MSVRVLLGDATGPLVRRKIVVFRRLEPGDTMQLGSHPLRESPYLEGKILEIALGKSVHDDMTRLAKRRAEVLSEASGLLSSYDLAGMIVSGAGGGLFGVWLDYLPGWLTPYLVGAIGVGAVVGFWTRMRKRGAELAAEEKWRAAPERKEHDELARTLSEKWIAFGLDVKKEMGFHTEVRVAEGSDDPLRLASIDPRGFVAMPPYFDPEDFLPTDGAGVRYEAVHAGGEVVTRLCEGDRDVPDASPKSDAVAETPKPAAASAEPVRAEESEVHGEDTSEGEGEPPAASAGSAPAEGEAEAEAEAEQA
ncbi:MAG: hypothetical protein U0234_07350 [Sandaracinus sp.]